MVYDVRYMRCSQRGLHIATGGFYQPQTEHYGGRQAQKRRPGTTVLGGALQTTTEDVINYRRYMGSGRVLIDLLMLHQACPSMLLRRDTRLR